MAKIPDLRNVDPARTGVGVDSVAIPDIIEVLKAFNSEWDRFEGDMDKGRIKELISICKSGESLFRLLSTRVGNVRYEMRAEELDVLQRKLAKAQEEKAERYVHSMKEATMLESMVDTDDTMRWIKQRVERLQKRIQNRKDWEKRNKRVQS